MSQQQAQVILLHGMGRSPRSMLKIERALKKQDYRVLNIGYSANSNSFEQILERLVDKIKSWVDSELPVHFIGHSFGGILIRGILAMGFDWNYGRCVMLGSPNQGTSIATYMTSHTLLKHFTPRVAQELMPDSELLENLPEPEIETGIIAGNKKYSPVIPVTWFYKVATGDAPGDGVVELSNTQCRTMADFIVLPLHHSFMMWDSKLIKQIVHFLENGNFVHSEAASAE